MNVKFEDNSEYLKCNNCMIMMSGTNIKICHSRICLHKLCEPCYQKVFTAENPTYKCTICSKIHELKDYSTKTREDAFYEHDYRIRHKLMSAIYKRLEDFKSEEEYNDYLEEIEDKILNSKNIDELAKDFQTKISTNVLNKNLVKRNEELNALDEMRRRKDPNRIYNSKIELEDEFTSMQVDLNEFQKISAPTTYRNINVRYPILIENATIAIIRDKNLMMKAGGFEYDKAYNELEIYSRLGL